MLEKERQREKGKEEIGFDGLETQVVLEDGIKSQEVEEPMTRIWDFDSQEIVEVDGFYYHCKSEKYYQSQILEHRRKPLKKYHRISRVKGVKTFLEGANRLSEEYDSEPMTSEIARSFGFCYNCGNNCPMWYKVEEVTE